MIELNLEEKMGHSLAVESRLEEGSRVQSRPLILPEVKTTLNSHGRDIFVVTRVERGVLRSSLVFLTAETAQRTIHRLKQEFEESACFAIFKPTKLQRKLLLIQLYGERHAASLIDPLLGSLTQALLKEATENERLRTPRLQGQVV